MKLLFKSLVFGLLISSQAFATVVTPPSKDVALACVAVGEDMTEYVLNNCELQKTETALEACIKKSSDYYISQIKKSADYQTCTPYLVSQAQVILPIIEDSCPNLNINSTRTDIKACIEAILK